MFLCSRGHEDSVGMGPALFQGDSACEALKKCLLGNLRLFAEALFGL